MHAKSATQADKSAVTERAWRYHQPVLWDNTGILDEARNKKELQVKKALYISLADFNTFNREAITVAYLDT